MDFAFFSSGSPSCILSLFVSNGVALACFSCSDWLKHPLISVLGLEGRRESTSQRATGGPAMHRRAPVPDWRAPASNTIGVSVAAVSLISSRRAANEWHYDPHGGSLGGRGESCRRDVSSCRLSLTSTDTRPPFLIKRRAALNKVAAFRRCGFKTFSFFFFFLQCFDQKAREVNWKTNQSNHIKAIQAT